MIHRRQIAAGTLAALAASALGAPSVFAQTQTRTLLDVINRGRNTQRFAAMIKEGHAEAEFTGTTPRTVFVPSDEAIEQVPPLRFQQTMGNQARLRELVMNHIVSGVTMIDLTISDTGPMGSDIVRSLGGHGISITFGSGGLARVNGQAIVLANVPASNGIIHVVSSLFEG